MIPSLETGVDYPTNIISIQGGLGNQLFEWAFAHALASKGSPVLIDTVRCRGNRPLEIAALLKPYRHLAKPWGYAAALAHKSGLWELRPAKAKGWRLVRETGFGFDPEFMDSLFGSSSGRNYILGYFQSPKYFAGYEDSVRRSILEMLSGMLTAKGVALADEFANAKDTVAVHVRRGDYVSDARVAAHHGSLQRRYYEQALAAVRDVGKTRIIWFSDDTDWVKYQMARPEDSVATPAMMAELTTKVGGEIALMAACSSRIVANSSFSWWAGWLGGPSTLESPVISPSNWLVGTSEHASDLVPADWLRL